jgi:hypothetical protein
MSQPNIRARMDITGIARKILAHVVEYFNPFSTKITIENGVAVIRLPAPQDSAHANTS